MHEEAQAVLRSMPIFQRLSEDALEIAASRTVVRNYARGTVLFREGQEARGLFVVVKGSVRIYRSSADGREQILLVEGSLRSLAELPLFDGLPYPASARVEEDSRLLFLPRDSFERLFRSNPEIAEAALREYGRRVRKLVRLVEKLALKDVPARVATALLEQAAAADAARDGGRFTLTQTREELAEELGTTRESVSRAMSSLSRSGAIHLHGARVTVLSVATLTDAAGVSLASVWGSVLQRTPVSMV